MPDSLKESTNTVLTEKPKLPSRHVVIGIILTAILSIVGVCFILIHLHSSAILDVAYRNLYNLSKVEKQVSQRLFTDLEDVMVATMLHFQQERTHSEIPPAHYDLYASQNPLIHALHLYDHTATLLWTSQPDQVPDATKLQIFDRENANDRLIFESSVGEDQSRSIRVSRALYDSDDSLQYVAVATISSSQWSDSLINAFDIDDYVEIFIDHQGYVLTTVPYREELIGTQLSLDPMNRMLETDSQAGFMSSMLSDDMVLMSIQSIDGLPIYLVLEDPDFNQQFSWDNVISTIFVIAAVTVISGCAILILYLYQHRILQLQMTRLFHLSHDLQEEVKVHGQTEASLLESEQRYRIVTELVSDYAYSTIINEDGTGVREWLTESFYSLPDYATESVTAVPKSESGTHPDDVERVEADIARTTKGEDTVTEYRLLSAATDKYIWLRVKRRPIWDEDHQKVIRIVGAVSNITAEKEAEMALRESEDRYRLVTELISDYAYSTRVLEDGTLEREWVTDSFYIMTGYSPETLDSVPNPEARTHPEDLDLVKGDLNRTLQGEETMTEYRWMSGFGDYMWLRVKRRPIWDEDHQKVIRIIAAVSDITAEKEAELALRESEERYRKVTELISDYAFSIIVEKDKSLKHHWLTPSYYRLLGYTPDELDEDFELKDIVHPDDQVAALADLERVLNGETVTSEFRNQTKSGAYIWLSLKRQPVWDEDEKRVVSYYGVARDITAQKEALDALQKSEERYRRVSEIILGYAFSVYVHQDGTLEMEWATESIYLMTGFSPEEIAQQGTDRTHPNDIQSVQADINRTLSGVQTTSEYRSLAKSGDYMWIRVKRLPIWDDDHQRVIRILGAASDITSEKEAELALRESEERYRRVSNILTDFAYESYINPDGTTHLEWTFGTIEHIPIRINLDARTDQIEIELHPDDIAKMDEDLERTITQNSRTMTEYRVASDSGYRWVRTLREPVWDEDQQRVVRILGTLKDITVEKEAEFALEASQQRYREVTELMSDYAFSVTIANQSVKSNWVVGSLEQITGVTPQQVMKDVDILKHISHPDDMQLVEDDLQKTRQGEKTTSEYRIIHAKTGDIRWLRVKRQPIWNHDSTQVVRVLVGAADITAQKESEIALRESEERYRLVSQLISDYVFSVKLYDDLSSEVEWIAGAFENITGISIDEVTRLNLKQLPNQTHPDDYVAVSEDISKTYYGETTVSEYRIVNPVDDSIHWLHVVRQPIWDENREHVIRIIGAVSDVTGRKAIEDALRESEERYRQVTELISDYVYSLSVLPDDRIVMDWFAGSFEQITGMHISNYGVDTALDMIKGAHPDDYADAAAKVEATMAGESTVSEYRITNVMDYKPRWIRVSRFPVVDEKTGRVVRIFGAVTDVTAQKFAEMALRDSEERYRMLTDLMTDYAFSVRIDEDDRLYREWLVGDFESVMGYSIPEVGYLDDPERLAEYRTNIEMVQADIEQAKQGKSTITEYRIINQKDNQPRWIRVTRQPIWNKEHTRVVRYLGAVKDITLEKEAELVSREANELRQALEREKGLHALRSRFVSMVTHEFRNPLAAILSSVSILDKYNHRLTIESRREKFERIYGQIKRLTNLLEDLLEVGELEHRALRFSPQRVDLVELINDLYAEYQESIGSEHHLLITTNHPKVYTYADVQIMRQALGNIISNAIKYSPPESDVVCDVVLNGEKIIIHITDQGMGIPEMDKNDLFEAFYRASNVATYPGTGLGLLIARQSIEMHKGTISFSSVEGEGTTFTISIPRVIGKNGS